MFWTQQEGWRHGTVREYLRPTSMETEEVRSMALQGGVAGWHRLAHAHEKVPCMSAPIFKNAEMCEKISRPEMAPPSPLPVSAPRARAGCTSGHPPRPLVRGGCAVELPAPPLHHSVCTQHRDCRLFGRLSFVTKTGYDKTQNYALKKYDNVLKVSRHIVKYPLFICLFWPFSFDFVDVPNGRRSVANGNRVLLC